MTGKVRLQRLADQRKELAILYRELDFQRRASCTWGRPAALERCPPMDFQRIGQVEDLVLLIESDARPAFTVTPVHDRRPDVHANPVGSVLLGLDVLSEFLVTPVIQSARVSVFLNAMAQLRAERSLSRRLDGNVKATDLWLDEVDALNRLVEQIRLGLSRPDFKRRVLKSQSVADRRHNEASAYLEDILRRSGDLLVIPLEIKSGPGWRGTAGLQEGSSKLPTIVERFNAFKKQARHKSEWAHVVGFLGRWERSDSQGLYARVLFFLESARVSEPRVAADAIGKLWVTFTEGKGSFDPAYFISTDAEMLNPFRQVCRGSAKHRRELLEVALSYFTKQELVFRDPDLELGERFFRGERPSARTSEIADQASSKKRREKERNPLNVHAAVEGLASALPGIESPVTVMHDTAPSEESVPEPVAEPNVMEQPKVPKNIKSEMRDAILGIKRSSPEEHPQRPVTPPKPTKKVKLEMRDGRLYISRPSSDTDAE